MKRCLWVVEIETIQGWQPASDTGTTRKDGRIHLRAWREKFYDAPGKFRLVKYVPKRKGAQ